MHRRPTRPTMTLSPRPSPGMYPSEYLRNGRLTSLLRYACTHQRCVSRGDHSTSLENLVGIIKTLRESRMSAVPYTGPLEKAGDPQMFEHVMVDLGLNNVYVSRHFIDMASKKEYMDIAINAYRCVSSPSSLTVGRIQKADAHTPATTSTSTLSAAASSPGSRTSPPPRTASLPRTSGGASSSCRRTGTYFPWREKG